MIVMGRGAASSGRGGGGGDSELSLPGSPGRPAYYLSLRVHWQWAFENPLWERVPKGMPEEARDTRGDHGHMRYILRD